MNLILENCSKVFHFAHQYGRCCLHCGSWFTRDSLFCKCCEDTLWERHIETRSGLIDDISVSSLFHWQMDEDRPVSKLLNNLKGGFLENTFRYYAQEFLVQKKLRPAAEECVLVPCPGKRPDHAWVLAKQFSKLLSIPMADVLTKDSGSLKQKTKNRQERAKLHFSCQETMRQKHVIFIDDIVTTGASVRAARKAIGPCQSFQVWAIAQRVVSLRGPW